MTIFYPLSGASWPARKQASVNIEEPQSHAKGTPCRGTPPQWELRKVASLPILYADYWSDASLTPPHLAAKLPESVDTTASFLFSLHIKGSPLQSPTSLQVVTCQSARCAAFPPPLESPSMSDEGPFHHLQSINKVCFTSIRSNGRLLLMQKPCVEQTRRCLRSQRGNGRLLLQLYEESGNSEDKKRSQETLQDSPLVVKEGSEGGGDQATHRQNKKNPTAETMKQEDPFAEKAVRESPSAESAKQEDPLVAKEEEGERELGAEEEGGGGERKLSIYTKVLKTLDCDAFSDCSAEVLNLQFGRRSGVASSLYKSLFRIRPLDMLNLWPY